MPVRRRRTVAVNWTNSYHIKERKYSHQLTLTLLSRQDTQAMVACLLLAKDLGVGIFSTSAAGAAQNEYSWTTGSIEI